MRKISAGSVSIGAVALALLLAACTGPGGTDARPASTDGRVSASPSASAAATTPSVTPSTVPLDPADETGSGEPAVQPPANWTVGELIGACKAYWNETGTVSDWSSYEPEEPTGPTDGSFNVRLVSDTEPTLTCAVSGAPASPMVDGTRG